MTFEEIAVIVFGLFAGYWVVGKLLFKSPKADQPPPPAGPIEPAWHEILKIAPTASAQEIRTAYKEQIARYHPDKVDSLGQELKDLAVKKSQDITAAYQAGMRERGAEP